MKKPFAVVSLFLCVTLCLTMAFASGAGSSDPLVSLSYLTGLFSSSVNESVDTKLTNSDTELRGELQQQLDTMEAAVSAAAGQNFASSPTEADLKAGDILTGPTGLSVVHLAGTVRVELDSGAVVDVSTGKEIASGTILAANHRYLVAESSVARFIVLSPTAVLTYAGNYAFSLSQNTPDYFSVARALNALSLFQGTGTGFGGGFDLHKAPTRAEGLVMFIRILGEENAALACNYQHPFTDVPEWADRYVAWAYYQGYTNGVGGGKFGTQQTISAIEYQEFLLRALGYSVASVHDYSTSLERALEHGALTEGEYHLLRGEDFLRCHVVYLSYYSLDMILSGSQQTLAQRLLNAGVFSPQQYSYAFSLVNSLRIF